MRQVYVKCLAWCLAQNVKDHVTTEENKWSFKNDLLLK